MATLGTVVGKFRKFAALAPNARRALLRSHARYHKARLLGALLSPVSFLFNRGASVFVISYKPDFHYFFDGVERFDELRADWQRGNRTNNFGDLPRFYAFYQNVSQVLKDGIAGDLAEVGVYRGNSAKLLKFFALKWNRELFLFDTFAGLDPRDIREADAGVAPAGFTDVEFESVKAFVGPERTHFVRGHFPETVARVPDFADRRFAVVHIDCDLYEPVLAALEVFYPKLEPGALLILHDYSSGWWPGAGQAMDHFLRHRPERLVLIPDKSGTAIFRKV